MDNEISPLLPTTETSHTHNHSTHASIRSRLRGKLSDLEGLRRERDSKDDEDYKSWLGERLESQRTHRIVLTLIAMDAIFVLTDLSYSFLSPTDCTPNPNPSYPPHPAPEPERPQWLEILSYLSLAITLLFLIEIPLDFYAFGPRWFNLSLKKRPVPHAALHLFDAIVIIGTAIFEVILRGKEQELVGLLVLLRLWRLIKLVGGVAVGVGSWDEESVKLLEASEARIAELEQEVVLLNAQRLSG